MSDVTKAPPVTYHFLVDADGENQGRLYDGTIAADALRDSA